MTTISFWIHELSDHLTRRLGKILGPVGNKPQNRKILVFRWVLPRIMTWTVTKYSKTTTTTFVFRDGIFYITTHFASLSLYVSPTFRNISAISSMPWMSPNNGKRPRSCSGWLAVHSNRPATLLKCFIKHFERVGQRIQLSPFAPRGPLRWAAARTGEMAEFAGYKWVSARDTVYPDNIRDFEG